MFCTCASVPLGVFCAVCGMCNVLHLHLCVMCVWCVGGQVCAQAYGHACVNLCTWTVELMVAECRYPSGPSWTSFSSQPSDEA